MTLQGRPDLAIIDTPFARLALVVNGDVLTTISFVSPLTPKCPPSTPFLREVHSQLLSYCADPSFRFDLPYRSVGTPYQQRVWQQISQIRSGQVQTYRAIAQRLHSSPRAVGQACRSNSLPIVVPCHRVVAVLGLGGFNARNGEIDWQYVKWFLLRHEGVFDGKDTINAH